MKRIMKSPEISSYIDESLRKKRGKFISPASAEIYDFTHIMYGFYQKYTQRNKSTASRLDPMYTSSHRSIKQRYQDSTSNRKSEVIVRKLSDYPDISTLMKWYKALGLSNSIIRYMESSIRLHGGNTQQQKLGQQNDDDDDYDYYYWPTKPIHRDNILDPLIYSSIYDVSSNDGYKSIDEINLEEVKSSRPQYRSNGEINWMSDNENRLFLNQSHLLIEPFRPVPSCVRDLVSTYRHILEEGDRILLSQRNKSSSLYSSLTSSFFQQLASNIVLSKTGSEFLEDLEGGGEDNDSNLKIQALESTIGRHIEGMIDGIIELLFNTLEPFATFTNNISKSSETVNDSNLSSTVTLEKEKSLEESSDDIIKYFSSLSSPQSSSPLKKRRRYQDDSIHRRIKRFFDHKNKKYSSGNRKKQKISKLRSSSNMNKIGNETEPKQSINEDKDGFTWDHILSAIQWQAEPLLTSPQSSIPTHKNLPQLYLSNRVLERTKYRLHHLYNNSTHHTLHRKPRTLLRRHKQRST